MDESYARGARIIGRAVNCRHYSNAMANRLEEADQVGPSGFDARGAVHDEGDVHRGRLHR